MKKKTIAAIIAAACILAPAVAGIKNKPEEKPVNYQYFSENRKFIEKVDYTTFRSDLDSGKHVVKMPNQEEFVEDLADVLNNHPLVTSDYGFNFSRGVDKKEFGEFIFDYVLEENLGFKIKTPTDVIVGINMALEHLARYNKKMTLEHNGLGSDVDDDGRFDGVTWSSVRGSGWAVRKTVTKEPKKGALIAEKACEKTDGSPVDQLLVDGDGNPNAVELVCRNYTSALEIIFETAKERYPELTKDIELLQMLMPGHVFGAFINKKTLQYISVDPTWHDSGREFDVKTFVFPPGRDMHYDCLQDPSYFELLKFEEGFFNYWEMYRKEWIFHNDSKKTIEDLVQNFQELVKKYPDSQNITDLEVRVYATLGNYEEHHQRSFDLLKEIYDDKDRKERLSSFEHSLLLVCLGDLAYELRDYETALKFHTECTKSRVVYNDFVDDSMLEIAKIELKLGKNYEAMFRARDVLDLCPRHHKEAQKIVNEAAYNLWFVEKGVSEGLNEALPYYIRGDYEQVIEKIKGDDVQSKLFLAKAHTSLNNYIEAKTLYENVINAEAKMLKENSMKEDETLADIAKSELEKMNRKFFLYAYTHFFDERYGKAVDEFEFLKSQITPKEEVAEKLSFLLMYSYEGNQQTQKSVREAEYLLKTFPNSEYAPHVKAYLKQMGNHI